MNRRKFLKIGSVLTSLGYTGCKNNAPNSSSSEGISQIWERRKENRRARFRNFLGLDGTGTPENLERLVDYNSEIEPYLTSIEKAIDKYSLDGRIDPLLMLSIVRTESNFDEYAVSEKGAGGPFQIMPYTGEAYDLKIYGLGLYRDALSRNQEGLVVNYVRELKNAVSRKNQEELNEIDQRFVINLAANAAVRIFSDNLDQTRTLDRAIAAYYTGATNANKSSLTSDVRRYVRAVKRSRENFLEQLR